MCWLDHLTDFCHHPFGDDKAGVGDGDGDEDGTERNKAEDDVRPRNAEAQAKPVVDDVPRRACGEDDAECGSAVAEQADFDDIDTVEVGAFHAEQTEPCTVA